MRRFALATTSGSGCPAMTPAAFSSIYGGQDRQISLRVFHAEFPSRPAL
jgi:hypothetical protein